MKFLVPGGGFIFKMKAEELLKKVFPNINIPKRRSEKVKMRVLRRAVQKSGQSLVHKETLESMPKNKGLWCHAPPFSPSSFQSSKGKKMKEKLIEWLKTRKDTTSINQKIGGKDLEILILYKLVSKKKRDIDNITKNIIDSLHRGGLFNDDKQVKFRADKVEFIEVKDATYSSAYEKAIIRIDFFNNKNKTINAFNNIFK